jgi:hypothetical protein
MFLVLFLLLLFLVCLIVLKERKKKEQSWVSREVRMIWEELEDKA